MLLIESSFMGRSFENWGDCGRARPNLVTRKIVFTGINSNVSWKSVTIKIGGCAVEDSRLTSVGFPVLTLKDPTGVLQDPRRN